MIAALVVGGVRNSSTSICIDSGAPMAKVISPVWITGSRPCRCFSEPKLMVVARRE